MNTETIVTGFFTLGGVIAGGLIGFLATLARDKIAEIGERRRLAAALLTELSENRSRFSEFAERVQAVKQGDPLEYLFNRWSGQKYFPVYDNSTEKLGLFDPEDTAAVAHAVRGFKDLIEYFNMMHDREARFTDLSNQYAIAGRSVASIEQRRREIKIADAERLRSALKQLMEDVDSAIRALKKYTRKRRKLSSVTDLFPPLENPPTQSYLACLAFAPQLG